MDSKIGEVIERAVCKMFLVMFWLVSFFGLIPIWFEVALQERMWLGPIYYAWFALTLYSFLHFRRCYYSGMLSSRARNAWFVMAFYYAISSIYGMILTLGPAPRRFVIHRELLRAIKQMCEQFQSFSFTWDWFHIFVSEVSLKSLLILIWIWFPAAFLLSIYFGQKSWRRDQDSAVRIQSN